MDIRYVNNVKSGTENAKLYMRLSMYEVRKIDNLLWYR